MVLEELDDYNWQQVFNLEGGKEQGCANGALRLDRALPNDLDTSLVPFGREDVKRIVAMDYGEHDEKDWLVVGELHDGRYFAITAGCDYTGWG